MAARQLLISYRALQCCRSLQEQSLQLGDPLPYVLMLTAILAGLSEPRQLIGRMTMWRPTIVHKPTCGPDALETEQNVRPYYHSSSACGEVSCVQ